MYRMITGTVMLSPQEWECVRQLRASAVRLANAVEIADRMDPDYKDTCVSIERTQFIERIEA